MWSYSRKRNFITKQCSWESNEGVKSGTLCVEVENIEFISSDERTKWIVSRIEGIVEEKE